MSLRELRKFASSHDLDTPALKLPPRPEGNPPHGGYAGSIPYYAQTLDQLRVKCGEHGDAAVADAEWASIYRWLSKSDYDGNRNLSNPLPVVEAVTFMMREHDRARLNYPHRTGRASRLALNDLTPESRAEAELVAAETLADWEKAGKPGLTRTGIKKVQSYFRAIGSRRASVSGECG
jgi:hypothetical protein